MQTMAPPEEVLEERFKRIDERFDRVDENFARVDERFVEVDRRITETAKETDRRLKEVDRRVTEKSDETNRRLTAIEATNLELKKQMIALNVTFQRGSFAIVASVLGVIAAILAKGG